MNKIGNETLLTLYKVFERNTFEQFSLNTLCEKSNIRRSKIEYYLTLLIRMNCISKIKTNNSTYVYEFNEK